MGSKDIEEIYRCSHGEICFILLEYCLWMGTIAFLFYDSWWAILIGMIGAYPYLQIKTREKILQKKKRLLVEFKDLLGVLATLIGAGYSPENAFYESEHQLAQIRGEDSLLLPVVRRINQAVARNEPLGYVLERIANQLSLEDIQTFATIFVATRRMGGQLSQVIRSMIIQLQGKLEVEEEIQTTLAQKDLERRIMGYMPLGILLYMRLFAGNLMAGLYHHLGGYIGMSVALVIYLGSVEWGKRIITISI